MTYRADNELDLAKLAKRIERLQGDDLTRALAIFFGEGLMIAPLPLRLAVRYRAWRRRVDLRIAWIQTLRISLTNKTAARAVDEMKAQTIKHIRFGRDTEDKTSVGGFSQREINLVEGILDACEAA